MEQPSQASDLEPVRRYYDESASEYDGWLRHFDRVMLGGRRRSLCARAYGRTLEIAVGTGANLEHYGPEVILTGVDLSAGMLAFARRRAASLELPVTLEIGDAEHLAAPDGSFDTVVATLLLSTVPDPRRALAEMHRVLAPGGQLLAFDMTKSPILPVRWLEQVLDPIAIRYSRFSLLRDPLALLAESGFVVKMQDRSRGGIVLEVVAQKV